MHLQPPTLLYTKNYSLIIITVVGFFQMLDLASNLVDQLTIAADAVRVGAVVFGDNANVAIPIGTYVAALSILQMKKKRK